MNLDGQKHLLNPILLLSEKYARNSARPNPLENFVNWDYV